MFIICGFSATLPNHACHDPNNINTSAAAIYGEGTPTYIIKANHILLQKNWVSMQHTWVGLPKYPQSSQTCNLAAEIKYI